MDKDTYKIEVSSARQELMKAFKKYRRTMNKLKLLKKQHAVSEKLAKMGVVTNNRIPVVFESTGEQKVKVRVVKKRKGKK